MSNGNRNPTPVKGIREEEEAIQEVTFEGK